MITYYLHNSFDLGKLAHNILQWFLLQLQYGEAQSHLAGLVYVQCQAVDKCSKLGPFLQYTEPKSSHMLTSVFHVCNSMQNTWRSCCPYLKGSKAWFHWFHLGKLSRRLKMENTFPSIISWGEILRNIFKVSFLGKRQWNITPSPQCSPLN